MKGYVEKIIHEYPQMVREREHLKEQMESFEFLSADELISALSFSHPDGERVQSSDFSDKTARIALEYQNKMEHLQEELLVPIQKRYGVLDTEISFLESAIHCLPNDLFDIMQRLVIEGRTWDAISEEMFISITKLQKLRKAAIDYLIRMYQRREFEQIRMLLN